MPIILQLRFNNNTIRISNTRNYILILFIFVLTEHYIT